MTFQSIRPVRVYGFGAIEPVARNFIQFKSVAQQHIALSSERVISGDFEIEATFAASASGSGALYGSSGSFLRLGSGYQYMINGNYYNTGAAITRDGSLTTVRLIRVGSICKTIEDGIEVDSRTVTTDDFTISDLAGRGTSNFLDGILADVRVWVGGDRETGALINDWPLDDDLSTTTIADSTGNNPGTAVNLVEEYSVQFTLLSGDIQWVSDDIAIGDSSPTLGDDANIEYFTVGVIHEGATYRASARIYYTFFSSGSDVGYSSTGGVPTVEPWRVKNPTVGEVIGGEFTANSTVNLRLFGRGSVHVSYDEISLKRLINI